ncbi:hypothetical protein ABMZ73_11800 [Morganella morganii]|uniref:hypothetical protein n=1 Tax=Morganella morganii TaxID=582 RepID=UPI003EBBF4B1
MKNPKLIVKPFAKNGQKNVIPENYETSMESNQATWDQGFGQITMLPVAAGGLPPKGQDFNGIFNQISENIVYLSQGGRFKFSAEYAEAIGGYPKGSILQSDDEKKEYLSLIDNNKVDFNTASDISASWKLVNTDDLLAQIASKQPKGDYATKTELNSGLSGKQPVGDYATKTEVELKLDKNSVVQSTGTSTVNVMSQKTVTDEMNKKFDKTGGKITGQTDIEAPGGRAQTLKAMAGTSIYQELYLLEDMVAWWGIVNSNEVVIENRATGQKLFIGPGGFKIDGKNIATTDQLFGVGQTYKDVTSSRKNSVRYQNTSTKPIVVCVEYNRTAASADDAFSCSLHVNDERVDYRWTQANEIGVVSCIVPAGSYYEFKGGWAQAHPWESFVKWIELS